MTRWEYKTFKLGCGGVIFNTGCIDEELLQSTLNKLGSDGWELVSIVAGAGANGITIDIVAVLKRPKAS